MEHHVGAGEGELLDRLPGELSGEADVELQFVGRVPVVRDAGNREGDLGNRRIEDTDRFQEFSPSRGMLRKENTAGFTSRIAPNGTSDAEPMLRPVIIFQSFSKVRM